MKRSFLPINELVNEPYAGILGFPRATKRQLQTRIKELESLGITKVSFWGPTRIGTLDILGKGYVGIVILGRLGSKIVAIKIRRTDSQRQTLVDESRLLKKVNQIKVGPKFIASSKNFLVMEYLDGQKISDWVAGVKGSGATKEIKITLAKVLHDCFRLDLAGIDHGELSMISKHVIVGKKVTIIDFESSSLERRVSNITSATQGIYIGSGIAKKVSKIYKVPPKQKIINALREYKQDVSKENYENLLRVLKL